MLEILRSHMIRMLTSNVESTEPSQLWHPGLSHSMIQCHYLKPSFVACLCLAGQVAADVLSMPAALRRMHPVRWQQQVLPGLPPQLRSKRRLSHGDGGTWL